MTLSPVKAVLFDCDGVLVDSEPATFDLLVQDFAAYGLPLAREVIERDFIGGTMQNVYERALAAGAALPADWVAAFYDRLYAHLAKGTPLIPGIEAVLDQLDQAQIRYAVGSNGSREKMAVTLGQHPALMARFNGHLYSGQEMPRAKPAPDLYLHAAAQLGLEAADCVVVEDSPAGAKAAQAAGMRCFGYAAHTPAARLVAVGAEPFYSMSDLPKLIGIAG